MSDEPFSRPGNRRTFLKRAVATTLAMPFAELLARSRAAATPFPYVDGLCLMGSAGEIAASGLSSFFVDVSSGAAIHSTDGSLKFWRSFDACSTSITSMKQTLDSGGLGQAFLATKANAIVQSHRAGRTAVFFQFQGGGEAVEDKLERLEFFHAKGLRIFQITHHNNNAWGGGCIEPAWSGLTKTGFDGVERLHALRMIPDLAHVADPTALDVIRASRASRKPVIVSHGGARALVNNARCTPDEVIKGVADSGGMMGVFMMSCWLTSDAVPTVASYLAQIKHIVNVGGIDAVGIANDYGVAGDAGAQRVGNDNARAVLALYAWWDGVTRAHVLGFDQRPKHVVIPELNNVRRAFLIHAALEKAGYKPREVEKIMGGNWLRVLTETLG